MRRLPSFVLACVFALAAAQAARAETFTPGTDITSALQSALNAGTGGAHPDEAVIHLPAGTFLLSRTINLHGATLRGQGAGKTVLEFGRDLGAGTVGITGDYPAIYGPFEMDDLSVEGPRPPRAVAVGVSPSQMDGIHLYDSCVLRRVDVQFFHEGIVIDGNHHTLDTVVSEGNYDGAEYIVSSDGTYFDDYFVDCSLCANERAGVYLAPGSQMGGVTMLRTHTGFEPYSFLLDHDSSIGSSQFLQAQFEGVGNADIADTDGTSEVSNNFFTSCSGWGMRYNVAIPGQATTPSMRVGNFMDNVIEGAGDSMGPTPGDMSVTGCVNGNTWTCNDGVLATILDGQLTPITSETASGIGDDNRITTGGIEITLSAVARPVLPGQAVEFVPSHSVEVGPATGNGVAVGISLAKIVPGEAAWIAQHGIVGVSCDNTATLWESSPASSGKWLKVDPATGLAEPALSKWDGETIGCVALSDGTSPVPTEIAF